MKKFWKKKGFMWTVLVIALVGGLVHLFPETLTSWVDWGGGYLTVQRVVGFLTIVGLVTIGATKD